MYKIFSPYFRIDQVMARWAATANDFDEVVGYTYLGDVFLRNSKTGQFAILFTIGPELVSLDIYSFPEFEKSFLSHSEAIRTILQKQKLDLIEGRLGKLDGDEIYIPVPFPFMGGDRSIESYKKGNLFTYLDLVGGLQDID